MIQVLICRERAVSGDYYHVQMETVCLFGSEGINTRSRMSVGHHTRRNIGVGQRTAHQLERIGKLKSVLTWGRSAQACSRTAHTQAQGKRHVPVVERENRAALPCRGHSRKGVLSFFPPLFVRKEMVPQLAWSLNMHPRPGCFKNILGKWTCQTNS